MHGAPAEVLCARGEAAEKSCGPLRLGGTCKPFLVVGRDGGGRVDAKVKAELATNVAAAAGE